jgi:hypothetical protein
VAKDGADAEAERLGFFGGVGEFGDDAVDDAVCKQFRGPYSLFGSHGRSVAGVVVEDRTGAFGRQRGEPPVLRGQDPVGGQECQCCTASTLSEKHRDGGHCECDHFGDAPCDMSGQSTFLGLPGQRGTGGVDDGDQGDPQLRGQAMPRRSLSERPGSERRLGRLAVPVLSEQHTWHVTESSERQE